MSHPERRVPPHGSPRVAVKGDHKLVISARGARGIYRGSQRLLDRLQSRRLEFWMDDIGALLEPHIPMLRRYAWALLRDEEGADDLVHDCLERAISRWHQRRADGDLRAWLFAIERNLFLSGLRQKARRGPHVGIEALDELASKDASQDTHLAGRDILSALDSLPEEQRSVLLLVGVEDLSYEEVARTLGIPIGTVMSRLSRARQRVRRYLEGGGRAFVLRSVK